MEFGPDYFIGGIREKSLFFGGPIPEIGQFQFDTWMEWMSHSATTWFDGLISAALTFPRDTDGNWDRSNWDTALSYIALHLASEHPDETLLRLCDALTAYPGHTSLANMIYEAVDAAYKTSGLHEDWDVGNGTVGLEAAVAALDYSNADVESVCDTFLVYLITGIDLTRCASRRAMIRSIADRVSGDRLAVHREACIYSGDEYAALPTNECELYLIERFGIINYY
ncbi:MAG TPA: hypothetical protein VGK19_20675 [Capsulimonadaceae bacterium]